MITLVKFELNAGGVVWVNPQEVAAVRKVREQGNEECRLLIQGVEMRVATTCDRAIKALGASVREVL